MDFKEQAAMLDLVVRVFCLEKFLIEKKIIEKEEYLSELNKISEKLIKEIMGSIKLDNVNAEDILSSMNKIKN